MFTVGIRRSRSKYRLWAEVKHMYKQQSLRTGVLVHGCHLQAKAWDNIIWGQPPNRMGRVPYAVLLAIEEGAHTMIFGSGASKHHDGTLEGQYILNLLLSKFQELKVFHAFKDVDLVAAATFIKSIAIADTLSKSTKEELQHAHSHFHRLNIKRIFLVSSPTHMPRVLRDAAVQYNGPRIYGAPCQTNYANSSPSDVQIIEPPHRGDDASVQSSLQLHRLIQLYWTLKSDKKKQRVLHELEKALKAVLCCSSSL